MTTDTQEKRRYARKKTSGLLKVLDWNTRECLGKAINISKGGVLLLTRQDLQVNSIHQFLLEISGENGDLEQLTFGGEILWTDDSAATSGRWAGIQIIDISEEMDTRLDGLIDEAAGSEVANV